MANRKRKNPHRHPVGLFALGEDDHEFYHIDDNKRQPRVMIEQVDGDKFYFPDESNARQFIEFHGLKPIPSEELERLREAEAPRPEDDDE